MRSRYRKKKTIGANANKEQFLSFMYDHALINMNVVRSYGEYTFHNISNGDRSIIDYLLTDMGSFKVPEHVVLNGCLGTSAQTAHKAILSKVLIDYKESGNITKKNPRHKWRHVTEKKL